MHIYYSSRFKKQYAKLPKKVLAAAQERIRIFIGDEFDPILHNHSLHGEYNGCRSIDISGDHRLIYEKYADGAVSLVAIGTHHQLYG